MQHICLNEVISDISASACDGGDDTEASAGANVLHSRTPQSRTNKLRSGRFVKCVVLINCNHTCERIRPRACVCVVARLSWGLYFGQSGLTDNSPPCWSHLLLRGRKLIGSSGDCSPDFLRCRGRPFLLMLFVLFTEQFLSRLYLFFLKSPN